MTHTTNRWRTTAACLLCVGALAAGCAEGQVGPNNGTNDRPEDDTGTMVEPDAGMTDGDGGTTPDATVPPPDPGPSRAAINAGGGTRASENFRLDVVVGSPAAASQLTSENYRVGVGVGPFVARPTSPDGASSP